jgi:hypothetical protein
MLAQMSDVSNRVIVCGGRDYDDLLRVVQALTLPIGTIIIHGGCRGADLLCAKVWESWGEKTEVHKPAWDDKGSAAGPIRNQEMVDAGARLCIAFPGGKGTADCVARCEKAGIQVRKVGKRK